MAVTEAKQWVWEEFKEAMERNFWLAPRCFWKTNHPAPQERETGDIQAVYKKGEKLLTPTEEVKAEEAL